MYKLGSKKSEAVVSAPFIPFPFKRPSWTKRGKMTEGLRIEEGKPVRRSHWKRTEYVLTAEHIHLSDILFSLLFSSLTICSSNLFKSYIYVASADWLDC